MKCSSTANSDREDGEQHDRRSGIAVPAKLPNARSVHDAREVGHRVVADDDERQAAEERERADRHRQRRQAEARDEQPVERAAQAARDDAQGDDQLERQAVVPQRGHQRARQPEDRRHREVDLGATTTSVSGSAISAISEKSSEPVVNESLGEELRRDRLADRQQDDEERDEQRLPAPGDRAQPLAERGTSRAAAPRRARRWRRRRPASRIRLQPARSALLLRRAASRRRPTRRSKAIARSSSAPIAACCQNASTFRTMSER